MARRNSIPGRKCAAEKYPELLQLADISNVNDIQILFNETIAEFMENGLEAELDNALGYNRYDCKTRKPTAAETAIAVRPCVPALGMWISQSPGIERANLNPNC